MEQLNLTISLTESDSSANELLRGFINAVQDTRTDISRQLEELLNWASDLKRRDAELDNLLCLLISISSTNSLEHEASGINIISSTGALSLPIASSSNQHAQPAQHPQIVTATAVTGTVAPETLIVQRQKRGYKKRNTNNNNSSTHHALNRKLLFRNKDPEAQWHKPNQPIHYDNKFLIVNFGLQGHCAECEKDIVSSQAAVKVWPAPLYSFKARIRNGSQHEQSIDNASLNSATKLYCINHAPIPLEFKEVEEY